MHCSRRTLSVSAVASLAYVALLVPAGGPARAADPLTCQGQAATVTGIAGQPLLGTPDDDVIVSNGATSVDALGGDDLICVKGSPDQAVTVDAGDGNDTVATGTDGQRNHDIVDLGDGSDHLILYGLPGTGASYHAGDENAPGEVDALEDVSSDALSWRIDAFGGGLRAEGPSVNADGFEVFDAGRLDFTFLQFIGSPRADSLLLDNRTTSHRSLDVRMGNGDDLLDVPIAYVGNVHGGPGSNELQVQGLPTGRPRDSVDLDLAAKSMKVDGAKRLGVHSFTSIGIGQLVEARIQGSGHAESLSAGTCRATINGGGGDDEILARQGVGCTGVPHRSLHSHGGSGDDRIDGTSGNDLLIGGPGHDVAYGRGGRKDACSAEQEHSCEKRP